MKPHKLRFLPPLLILAFSSACASAALVAHYPLEGSVEQTVADGPAELTVFGTNPPAWNPGLAPDSTQSAFVGPNGASGSRFGSPTEGIWDGVTGFSVSAWIQPNTTPATGTIFWLGTGGSARFVLQTIGTELRAGGRRVAENGFNFVATTGLGLTVDQTYHVAATADYLTGMVNLYVNGVEVASQELTGWQVGGVYGSTSSEGTHVLRLATNATGGEVYQGLLDEVQVFNHTLSPSEVANLAIPEPTVSLLAGIGALGLLRRRRNH